MTPADSKAAGIDLARRSRKAQRLSPTIRDRDAVRRVVALLVARRKVA